MTSSVAYNTLLIKKNEPLEEQHQKKTLQRANVNWLGPTLFTYESDGFIYLNEDNHVTCCLISSGNFFHNTAQYRIILSMAIQKY